jgi:hypothetical protein
MEIINTSTGIALKLWTTCLLLLACYGLTAWLHIGWHHIRLASYHDKVGYRLQ